MGHDFSYVNTSKETTNEENEINIKPPTYENKETGIYASGLYIDTYGED